MPYRKLGFGGLELTLAIEDDLALKIRKSIGRFMPQPQRREAASKETGRRSEVQKRVDEVDWYHTIDVGEGVATPGVFDHRPYLQYYPIPASLAGKRVLDVATYDGSFAFEMESRGAAEVIAIDLESVGDGDINPKLRAKTSSDDLARNFNRSFLVAKELRQSKVNRVFCNVYDLSPERVGVFDFVFAGSLLLHLRDPLRALQAIRSVIGDSGVIVEAFNPGLTRRCAEFKGGWDHTVWWTFSLECLQKMVEEAGFSEVEMVNKFPLMNVVENRPIWHASFRVKA
jgi:tRNA (mo5U34)-methyltransferase